MRRDTTIINPRQLYIELGVDELRKLNCPQLGISHFYEFSLGQGKTHDESSSGWEYRSAF